MSAIADLSFGKPYLTRPIALPLADVIMNPHGFPSRMCVPRLTRARSSLS